MLGTLPTQAQVPGTSSTPPFITMDGVTVMPGVLLQLPPQMNVSFFGLQPYVGYERVIAALAPANTAYVPYPYPYNVAIFGLRRKGHLWSFGGYSGNFVEVRPVILPNSTVAGFQILTGMDIGMWSAPFSIQDLQDLVGTPAASPASPSPTPT
jgi:hypothetical protein